LRSYIAATRSIVVLTGAGVSAESGIPTFRGPGGLWREHRAEDLATPEAFARVPRLVWEWYDWRRRIVANAQPNPAHLAIARLEQRTPQFTLVTQNVDGLHHAAGSRNVVTLHGDLWTLRCVDCGAERQDRTTPLPELPPRCRCGGLERPGVVWFGEALPEGAIEAAYAAVEAAELVLIAGTSGVVWPAAGLAEAALRDAKPVIVVDPNPEAWEGRALVLQGRAGEVLPQLTS
jgi:NAD-dependent deacetylase